ncbi:unnamed protein product [Eretmochelys imbricata]
MVGFLEILFACLLPSVLWAIRLEQVPISIIKKPHEDTIAEFTCKLSDTLESTNIHWYRAPTGGAPQRLLYLSYSKPDPSWDAGFSSKKLTAHFQGCSICKLLVHKLEKADSGHYYCAAWDYTQCHKPPAALHKETPKQQNHTHHSLGGWAQLSRYCCSKAHRDPPSAHFIDCQLSNHTKATLTPFSHPF